MDGVLSGHPYMLVLAGAGPSLSAPGWSKVGAWGQQAITKDYVVHGGEGTMSFDVLQDCGCWSAAAGCCCSQLSCSL